MSVATDRQVQVNLRANVTPYIAALRQATRATGELDAALNRAAAASQRIRTATQQATAATGQQLATARLATAQYQQQTAQIAAQTAALERRAARINAQRAQSLSDTAASRAQAAATQAATAAIEQQTAALALQRAQQQALNAAESRRLATLNKIGAAATGVGGLLVLSAGVAVAAYARFEKQMSAVAAVTGATSAELDVLADSAIRAGASTAFSATEAAKAQTELAKVGISTADILGGALTGSLNLAAAGGVDLARAAEVAGQAMKIFSLQGRDVGQIADALANGANQSAADVEQLAQALSQGGLVAAQTGLDLQDSVGVLAAFADNALIGSDAGTSFKTMLQRLTPQSDEAAREMERLGINAFDASGEFVGITALAGQLQDSLGGLTTEQRNASLSIIFGSDAVRAANVLYSEGARGIAGYIDGVSQVGTAALTAATQLDNLLGDLEALKGAVETALIQNGEGANGVLREMVQNLTDATRWYTELDPSVRQAGTQLALIAGVLLVVSGGLTTLTVRAIAARNSFTALQASSPGLANALTRVGKAAGVATGLLALGAALTAVAQASDEPVPGLEATTRALLDLNAAQGTKSLDDLFESIDDGKAGLSDFGDAVDRVFNKTASQQITDWGDQSIGALVGVTGDLEKTKDVFDNVGQSLAVLVDSGDAEGAAALFDQMAVAALEQSVSTEELLTLLPAYREALARQDNTQQLAATSAESMAAQLAGLAPVTDSATEALDVLDNTIKRLTGQAFEVEIATVAYEAALDSLTASVAENGTSLDLSTDAGRANAAALQDQTTKAAGLIQAMANQGATADVLAAKTGVLRQQLYDTAIAAGFSKDEANRYASVLDTIPSVVQSEFLTPGLNAALSAAQALDRQLLALNRTTTTRIQTITSAGGNTGGGYATGGYVQGPGTTTSDSIPALLSNKEYVINAAAVARYGKGFFDQVNAMRFADGGYVSRSMAPPVTSARGAGMTVNVSTTADAPLAQHYAEQVANRVETKMRDAAAIAGLTNFGG